jgi:thiol-disulfide isomerase/thioredoxin
MIIAAHRVSAGQRTRTTLTALVIAASCGFGVPSVDGSTWGAMQPEIVPSPTTNPKDVPPEQPGEPGAAPEGAAPVTPPAPAPKVTTPPPAAVNDKPGSELFIAAAEAVKKAQSITYHLKYHGTGGMAQYSSTVDAEVRMLRDSTAMGQTNGWRIRSTGSGSPKPGAENISFDVAWMGNPIEFVVHSEKKVIERRKSQDAKSPAYSVATSARVQELFAAKPFNREVMPNADYKVLDQQTIDGELCDVVEVTFGERKGKSIWAFSAKDHLPRRYESVIDNMVMSGTTVIEVNRMKIDQDKPPKLSVKDLQVEVPEGYTEDRPPKPTPVPAPVTPVTGAKSPESVEEKPKGDVGKEPVLQPTTPPPDGKMAKTIEKPATEVSAEPTPAAAVTPTLREGPAFNLKSSAGGNVSLASLKGNVVVLEFGGSWCLPCRDSRPELDRLAGQFAGKAVKVLSLSVRDKSPDLAMERFKAQNHAFPLLVEADSVATAYQVRTYPSYYVLGFEGEVLKHEAVYAKDSTVSGLTSAIENYLSLHPAKPEGN